MSLTNPELPIPTPRKSHRNVIILVVVGMIAVPTVMLLVIFPWLSQPAFTTVDEIDVTHVESIRIQFLNPPHQKDDIGPVYLASEDIDAILAPLRRAEAVSAYPPSAHMGEYRVRFKDGRRGTIRLTWLMETRGMEDTLASRTSCLQNLVELVQAFDGLVEEIEEEKEFG